MRLRNKVVGCLCASLQRVSSQILELILKSPKLAKAKNRRRIERDYQRAGNPRKASRQPRNGRCGSVRIYLALFKRTQVRVQSGLVGRRAGGAKTNDGENSVYLRVARNHFFHLPANVARVGERSALGSLDNEHQIPLIILGIEGTRNGIVNPLGRAKPPEKNAKRPDAPPENASQTIAVNPRSAAENHIKL